MSSRNFSKGIVITFFARIVSLILGVFSSVIIARRLGPEGKGIYMLAILLPSLIVAFANLGIGPATVYYVAKKRYSRPEVAGNNILFALGISIFSLVCGLLLILFFNQTIFPGVAKIYLIFGLSLIPFSLIFVYLNSIFVGAQRFIEYNFINILHSLLFLSFIIIGLLAFRAGISGAIFALAFAWFTTDMVLLKLTKGVSGGINFRLNLDYCKKISTYGIQAHLANIIGFLNLRLDIFIVNRFLNLSAVGFYSVAVILAERIWMVSQVASIIIFPMISGEIDEHKRKEFTPLVARIVFWITATGAIILFFLSHWIIEMLYSSVFLPAVRPVQILLFGIVTLSISRILAHDLAGRGRPILNAYIAIGSLFTNIILNVILIPKYGISGVALASTVSYTISFLVTLWIYCRITENSWTKVILPQQGDLILFLRTGVALGQMVKMKIKAI